MRLSLVLSTIALTAVLFVVCLQSVQAQSNAFQAEMSMDCLNNPQQVLASELMAKRAKCEILFPGDTFTVTVEVTNTSSVSASESFVFTPPTIFGNAITMVTGEMAPLEKKSFNFTFKVPFDAGTSLVIFSVTLSDGSTVTREIDILNISGGCSDQHCPTGPSKVYLPLISQH